ncbi:hypothetical protein Cal6303_2940 [Calothrix sp. PCC 6303]|nr:hypothetical protein Cal6303_2940 [Calothrix sp. PCC 6303]
MYVLIRNYKVIWNAQLAVDIHRQGKGSPLVWDAALRTLQVVNIAGLRAILVDTISQEGKQFYSFPYLPHDPDDSDRICIRSHKIQLERN